MIKISQGELRSMDREM